MAVFPNFVIPLFFFFLFVSLSLTAVFFKSRCRWCRWCRWCCHLTESLLCWMVGPGIHHHHRLLLLLLLLLLNT